MKIWTTEEEAAKLKERFAGINRAAFARNYSLKGGQSIIYQHINALRPISLEAALIYARGFSCNLEDISPRLALETRGAAAHIAQLPNRLLQKVAEYNDIGEFDEASVLIRSAAGLIAGGKTRPESEHHQNMHAVRLSRSWLKAHLPTITDIDNLALLPASGNAMSPTWNDGDVLMIDRGVRDIGHDAVYVISRNNATFIKRVHRRLQDGALVVKSDNPLFGPDDVIDSNDHEQLAILGRIVWVWSGKKV